ncbi:3-oxoacyl-[acyl-carrier-protein] reductase FabG [Serratia plymuthica]|uniref:SDR family NAD(P)-dependent oxidoreductase n=1 Tax=Serratia plymuthica TaxID=82996 RepID=UPI0007878CD6|nr:SDR family NAD(P)-dependent oxidoreductase [Serratia plymuthica]QJW54938.1 3-oxoacyl-[acyl-carrier-protein] reductase FabG [Serratia plymuthica]
MFKKVVLVTGGGRGIGREICMELASEDTHVALTYTRDIHSAEQVKQTLEESNVSCSVHQLDVQDFHRCQSVVEAVEREYGTINVLVNNAGVTLSKQFVNCDEAENKAVLSTNLQGVINMMLATVPSLKKSTKNDELGRVVNISSNTSLCGNAGQVAYSVTKAGVNGFTRLCARTLASHNIFVNAVAPGYIDTDMTHDLPEGTYSHVLQVSAIKRVGRVKDVSSIVQLLCGDHCNYMTGQVIHIDGGKFC